MPHAAHMNDRTEWITPQLVEVALARLRNSDRRLIAWRLRDGWSYAEIAAELGLSRKRVLGQMSRALYRLRIAVEAGRQEADASC